MNRSPAYSFIRERLDHEFEQLDKQKITPWAFLRTKYGVKVAGFDGREISFGGLEFDGTPRHIFWEAFAQPFLKDIVSRGFAVTRAFCKEHGIDATQPMEETAAELRVGVEQIFTRMAEIDRRLRGKGFPDRVAAYNPAGKIKAVDAFVTERLDAEIAIFPKPKSRETTRNMKKPKQVKTAFSMYTIQDSIGEGGSGIVYQALDDNGNPVAIKILNPQKASRDKLKRFENEYRFCSKNKHENIIAVLDYGLTDGGDPFFVMPLYDYSLRKMIGKIEPNLAFEIFKKLIDGVEAAHKLGVTHRDLKPENVLVRNRAQEIVVADFGIARFGEEDLYTAVETNDGTRLANFQYAAPEQRSRGKNVDHRADIYALGLILNEMFTSELAHGTNFKTVKAVSAEYAYLDDLVDKMLQQDPTSRYQNIDDLKKDLIARSGEHIIRQTVSRLKNTVIPTTEIDDPLIYEPMKIVGIDWINDVLTIKLNHPVNPIWLWAINSMDRFSSLLGKEPERFQFVGTKARIPAAANEVQEIVDYFREWLPIAHRVYAERLGREKLATEREERENLKRRIEQEEERAKVLRNLKY